MPIITLQRQMRELGRIRTGNQVAAGNGRKRPAKLETFRLTSDSKELVDAAAEAYGGVATPWDNNGSKEFEVVTTTPVLDIVVPPGQPVSQWYELWSGGGCQRRCDGVTNVLTMQPCECPADIEQRLELAKNGQACKATTRLNVMLPALPDLGVWRLESHGYYAAVELAGAAEILAMASATGRLIPARLRLDQREKKVPGKPTNRYAVPVIEFVSTKMADLQLTEPSDGTSQLTAGGRAELPPPPALPDRSSFRAPSVPVSPEESTDPDWTGAATAEPAATSAGLVEQLRSTAEASAIVGAMTAPQRAALVAILAPLKGSVGSGMSIVFGEAAAAAPSAAEAQALINVHQSMGSDAFVAAWRELVKKGAAA